MVFISGSYAEVIIFILAFYRKAIIVALRPQRVKVGAKFKDIATEGLEKK